MTSKDWLAYFRQNRENRVPVSWPDGIHLPVRLCAPVARSLARFQLGESSDGARLRAAAWRLVEQTGDVDFGAAMELFVAEEQEHGRLLGRALEAIGATRLRRHWSDWLFRRCRHRLGLYGEIVVLLIAELIALKYYNAIRLGAGDAVLATVCTQLLYDKKFHVRFHCQYLHRFLAGPQRRPLEREAFWWLLTGLYGLASCFVAWNHRQALRALGTSMRGSRLDFAAARRAIFSGMPFEWDMTDGPSPALLRQTQWRGIWNATKL